VDIEHLILSPVGSRPADKALTGVEESDADCVIVLVGSYACAVKTVYERVRRRFGKRAAGRFRVFEHRFERSLGTGANGDHRTRLNDVARRVLRRIAGSEAPATVAEVVATYSDVLRRLASREGCDVLVFPEPNWTVVVERANPGANRIFGEVRSAVKEVTDEHRLLWVDPNPAFAAAPDQEALYMADGVHKTAEAHRMQAEIMTAAIQEARLTAPERPAGATASGP